MNSVLQQLYIQPDIKEAILSVERDEEDTSSVTHTHTHPWRLADWLLSSTSSFFLFVRRIFPEIQTIFGHLLESKLQYFSPESFWKAFKIEGQPVNVHEHQVS